MSIKLFTKLINGYNSVTPEFVLNFYYKSLRKNSKIHNVLKKNIALLFTRNCIAKV